MTDPEADPRLLWEAVDKLTQPSTRRVFRDNDSDSDAVDETVTEIRRQDATGRIVRNDLARYTAMRRSHATVPSLWDQSVDALTSSTADKAEGSSGDVHRTPMDLNLMEMMATIREFVEHDLRQRGEKPIGTVPEQIRHLAAWVVTNEKDQIWWFEYRMSQYARALGVYLKAVQTQPKPRRLRGAACPECKITSVVIEDAIGEPVKAPPIVIDFENGLVRAAECQGCGYTWWRGDQLGQLADLINPSQAESA